MAILKNTGLMIFSWIGISLIVIETGLWLGYSVSKYELLIITGVFSIVFIAITHIYKLSKKVMIISLLLFVLMILCALFVAISTRDFSWDGQTYHQEALIQLQKGWNPVKNNDLYTYLNLPTDGRLLFPLWVSHYPQGLWFIQTLFYDLMGNIEAGKAVNVLLIFGVLCVSIPLLTKLLKNKFLILVFSFLLIMNPIVSNQIFTFYNDATIYLLLTALFVLSLSWYFDKSETNLDLLGIFGVITLLVSIKFTALAYTLLFILIPLSFIIRDIYMKKKSQKLWSSKNINAYICVTVALIVGVLFIGRTSYVNNTINNGHPFYPLAGVGKRDIMSYNYVEGTEEIGRVGGLYISQFSEVNNVKKIAPQSKFPFEVKKEEKKQMVSPDVRIGGFGPLFGASLILLTIGLARFISRSEIKKQSYLIISVIFILASCLVNPETWWSRYIPQFWLLPLLGSLFLIFSSKKMAKLFAYAVLGVLVLNSTVVAFNQIKWQKDFQTLYNKQLKILQSSENIDIDFQTFQSNRERLKASGISFNNVEHSDKKYSQKLIESSAIVFTDDKKTADLLKKVNKEAAEYFEVEKSK